ETQSVVQPVVAMPPLTKSPSAYGSHGCIQNALNKQCQVTCLELPHLLLSHTHTHTHTQAHTHTHTLTRWVKAKLGSIGSAWLQKHQDLESVTQGAHSLYHMHTHTHTHTH